MWTLTTNHNHTTTWSLWSVDVSKRFLENFLEDFLEELELKQNLFWNRREKGALLILCYAPSL